MVSRPARGFGLHAIEAQDRQIQLLDKGLNGPHRIVLADVIVQALRKQRALGSILAFDKSFHRETSSATDCASIFINAESCTEQRALELAVTGRHRPKTRPSNSSGARASN